MPTPIGHSLVGLSIGMAYALPSGKRFSVLGREMVRRRGFLLAAVALANLPDIDYVPGILTGDLNAYHHHYSHTLGWLMLTSVGIWMIWKALVPEIGGRQYSFLFLTIGSHLILDYITANPTYPYGILLLWPLSNDHYLAANSLFWNPAKADWGEIFQWYNVRVMAVDALYTGFLAGAVLMYKRFCGSGR